MGVMDMMSGAGNGAGSADKRDWTYDHRLENIAGPACLQHWLKVFANTGLTPWERDFLMEWSNGVLAVTLQNARRYGFDLEDVGEIYDIARSIPGETDRITDVSIDVVHRYLARPTDHADPGTQEQREVLMAKFDAWIAANRTYFNDGLVDPPPPPRLISRQEFATRARIYGGGPN